MLTLQESKAMLKVKKHEVEPKKHVQQQGLLVTAKNSKNQQKYPMSDPNHADEQYKSEKCMQYWPVMQEMEKHLEVEN